MSTESTSSGVCSLVGHQLLLTRSTCPWVPTSQTHHKYLLCLCALCLYRHASVEWTDLPTTSTCSVCLRDDCTVTPQWNELTYLPQVPVAFVCVMTVQSRLSGMIDLPTTSTCSVCVHYVCTVTPQWSALDPTHTDTRIFIHQWHKNVHWNLSWCRYNHSENEQYTTATSVIKNNY